MRSSEWRPIFDLQVLRQEGISPRHAATDDFLPDSVSFMAETRRSNLARSQMFQPRGPKFRARTDLKLRNTNFEYGKWPLLNQNQATGWRSHLSVVVHVKFSKRRRQFLTRNRRLFSGGCGNGERPSNRNLPRASRRRRRSDLENLI